MPAIRERRHLCRSGIMNYRLAVVCASVLRELGIVQPIGGGERCVADALDLVVRHRLQRLLLRRFQQVRVQFDLVNLFNWLLRVFDDAKVALLVHERLSIMEPCLEIRFLHRLVLYV